MLIMLIIIINLLNHTLTLKKTSKYLNIKSKYIYQRFFMGVKDGLNTSMLP